MVRKPINQVVAEALRFYMGDKWTDYSLGKRAGVAANTVRNYLSPEQRQPGKSGKEPSAKLTELAKLAAALDVEVADLVTDISENARRLTLRQKAAAYYADNGRLPSWAPDPEPDVENRKATVARYPCCLELGTVGALTSTVLWTPPASGWNASFADGACFDHLQADVHSSGRLAVRLRHANRNSAKAAHGGAAKRSSSRARC